MVQVVFWLSWLILVLSSAGIVYQDFKTRLISIWLILCFAIANFTLYLIDHSLYDFLENSVFCLAYFLMSYLVLVLFYFLKAGRFQKILDNKIGWGDVWLLFVTGCVLPPQNMIVFFTITFIVAVLIQLIFFRNNKSIALGAILLICYGLQLILSGWLLADH